ncbi:MAG: hypothetical protein HYY16_01155 [Planctomycetes bacterium]|nr:hypothetical protein [Planctomycetota bacterium]
MKLDELTRRRDLLCLATAAASGAVALLSAALAFCALRPRPVVVVPGAAAPRIASPGDVPDAAAVSFCLIHIYEFDSFTPGTIETATRSLKGRIAPRAWAEAGEGLDRRARVIQEGRISSQVVVDPQGRVERAPQGTIAVTLEGTRRVFIADKLSREERVRYRLELEPCAPTSGNPHGLAVLAQSVEEVADAARR